MTLRPVSSLSLPSELQASRTYCLLDALQGPTTCSDSPRPQCGRACDLSGTTHCHLLPSLRPLPPPSPLPPSPPPMSNLTSTSHAGLSLPVSSSSPCPPNPATWGSNPQPFSTHKLEWTFRADAQLLSCLTACPGDGQSLNHMLCLLESIVLWPCDLSFLSGAVAKGLSCGEGAGLCSPSSLAVPSSCIPPPDLSLSEDPSGSNIAVPSSQGRLKASQTAPGTKGALGKCRNKNRIEDARSFIEGGWELWMRCCLSSEPTAGYSVPSPRTHPCPPWGVLSHSSRDI